MADAWQWARIVMALHIDGWMLVIRNRLDVAKPKSHFALERNGGQGKGRFGVDAGNEEA